MRRHLGRKVVNLKQVLDGRALAEGLQKTVVGPKELAGFDPAHAAYVYTQNQVSVMSEQLTGLKEMALFADIISKAEDLYMPSAPPMSTLTTSYFSCWAFFDCCAGPAHETIGTTILEFGAAFGMHNELLRLIQLMQDSRMGLYIHHGRDGNVTVLEDLLTRAVYRAAVPARYSGRKKERTVVRPCASAAHPRQPRVHRFHDALRRGTPRLPGLDGILPPHVRLDRADGRLRAPHEVRAYTGILERFRNRGIRDSPVRRDLPRRPARCSREPAPLRGF